MSDIRPQHPNATNAETFPPSGSPPPFATGSGNPLKRQQAVVAMGRKTIALPELSVLLQDAARLIAEMLDLEYSILVQPTQDGSKLTLHLTRKRADRANPQSFVHETDASDANSLAGHVLQIARPLVVDDLAGETEFRDTFLRGHGIKSALAVPLVLQDQSFGVLGACSTGSVQFDQEAVLCAETIAHLATTSIARARAEEMLTTAQQFSDVLFEAVSAIVLVLNSNGQIVHSNPACERVTGFSLAEIKGRPIWNVFPVPEEIGIFLMVFEQLRQGTSLVERESALLTKHAERRQIAWSFSALHGPDGSIELVIATGIDITQQLQAEENAWRTKQAADTVREAMDDLLEHSSASDKNWLRLNAPRMQAMMDEAIHETLGDSLLKPARDRRQRERRGRERLSYPYRQPIAPILEGVLPKRDAFVQMQCHDISAGGFSYVSPTPPESEILVIALGTDPHFTYLTAEVAHVTSVVHHGQKMHLVGCKYTGRANC